MTDAPKDPEVGEVAARAVRHVAPPVVAGAVGSVGTPAVWPGVLGTMLIVLGSLAILSGVLSLAFMLIAHYGGWFSGMPEMAAMMDKAHWANATYVVAIVVAVPEILGGIGLLKRRPRGPVLVTWWSCLRIVSALFTACVTWVMQEDVYAVQLRGMGMTGAGGAMAKSMLTAISGITFLSIIAIGWALPVFWLIWRRRPKVRAEIASWGRGP